MNIPMLTLSLLDPLYSLFGWVMRFIYAVFGNYGFAVIIFTVLIKLVLLPFSVKQHKSTIQQQALQPELLELQRYYGSDRNGYAKAQMELFEKHNVSMTGGCLPSLLSLVMIWPVYRIIQGPLYFIMRVGSESLQQITQALVDAKIVGENFLNMNLMHNNIFIIEALSENPKVFADVVDKGFMSVDQLLDLNFLGVNLGMDPTINFKLLFGPDKATYLPLLLFPLLAVLTSVIQLIYSQRVMNAKGMSRKEKKARKEKLKKNPALQEDEIMADTAQNTSKVMTYIMPVMTLIFTFTMPAAMSLYWIIGGAFGIFQTWLMNQIYTKPMAERQRIADEEFEEKVTARARKEKAEMEKLEQNNKKKKRRRRSK